MYQLLDIAFLIFHSGLILFNLFGWIWETTRRWNLATLLLTAFSWFGLGIFYGWGYCPCTHWHWMVRRKLGDISMPNSYIQFLIEEMTGATFKASLVDFFTVVLFSAALLISIFLNFRNFKKKPFVP